MIQKQRGISLIEILISMLLGLSLIAGISQLFIQSQKSFSMQRNLSDMTDDGSIALELLGKGFLQAGFAENGDTTGFPIDTAPFSGSTITLGLGEYLKGTNDGTNDEIIYRYRISDTGITHTVGDMGELDNFICSSTNDFTAAVVGEMLTVRIYVKKDSNNIPFVRCSVKTDSISAPTAEEKEELISEVYRLIIRYGVRATGGLYYTDQANVVDWTKVVALKIFLVLRSADDNLTRNNAIYYIEGVAQPVVPDKRLYKVFSKTIYLRAPDH